MELGLIGIISFFLFFVSTSVNPVLGGIYQGLALLGIVLAIVDISYGRRSLNFINPKIAWMKALLISGVAYLVLVFSTHLASGLAKSIPLTEILSLLGATAPIFSQSPSINFIIFAIVIPIIETYVIFCIAIDLFGSMFKMDLSKKGLFTTKVMSLIILISLAFLLFHVQAKGIENEASLILVGIMAFISCVLVIWFQEFRVSILLHIWANVIASVSIFSSLDTVFKSILPFVGGIPF